MNKTISFIKLDYITIKPYLTWRNLIIAVGLFLFMALSNKSLPVAIGTVLIFGALYMSFPFSVGEKNGIDSLYVTLSIDRAVVVSGRYLFALTLDLCAGVIAYVLAFVASMILKINFVFAEIGLMIIAIILVYSIIQAFQLPIYFKLGYTKAKFVAYFPFLGLSFGVVGVSSLIKNMGVETDLNSVPEWIGKNSSLFLFICIALWFAIIVISYRLSVAFYRKREF